jgi:hypothetical protein
VSAAALPFIDGASQERLIWFVTLFPSGLVGLFFLTLWFSPRSLYGPKDFQTDEGYLAAQTTLVISEAYSAGDSAQKLRSFWMSDGVTNEENAAALRQWMEDNEVGANSITAFLNGAAYRKQRDRAVAHFNL